MLLQTPIVAARNVLSSTSSSPGLPGMMLYMSQSHVQILLSCLDLSYDGAIRFDCRPGLKFLVQKVAGLEQAANLYRQAGAAWTLKVVTLFDLSLHEVKVSGATLDTVKQIIEDEDAKLKMELSRSKQSIDSNKSGGGIMETRDLECDCKDMSTFLTRLRQSFDTLCETYIDVVLDKDGTHSAVDRISDEPIFFLIAQPDDFPIIKNYDVTDNTSEKLQNLKLSNNNEECEYHEKTTEHNENDSENDEPEESKGLEEQVGRDDVVEQLENSEGNNYKKEDTIERKKPFLLSDLAQQYEDTQDCSENSVEESLEQDEVIDEYKKRKQMCIMPPQPGQWEKRKNPFTVNRNKTHSMEPPLTPAEPLPPEIELQRKTSIYKVSHYYTVEGRKERKQYMHVYISGHGFVVLHIYG